jgi:hypothetical protein
MSRIGSFNDLASEWSGWTRQLGHLSALVTVRAAWFLHRVQGSWWLTRLVYDCHSSTKVWSGPSRPLNGSPPLDPGIARVRASFLRSGILRSNTT